MDIAGWVSAVFGAGGAITALVMLLKVRTENRKTSADAAAVLAGSAAEYAKSATEAANAAQASATAALADAAAARAQAERNARRAAHLGGLVEALNSRVAAINVCPGGLPCPQRTLRAIDPPAAAPDPAPSTDPVTVTSTITLAPAPA